MAFIDGADYSSGNDMIIIIVSFLICVTELAYAGFDNLSGSWGSKVSEHGQTNDVAPPIPAQRNDGSAPEQG